MNRKDHHGPLIEGKLLEEKFVHADKDRWVSIIIIIIIIITVVRMSVWE